MTFSTQVVKLKHPLGENIQSGVRSIFLLDSVWCLGNSGIWSNRVGPGWFWMLEFVLLLLIKFPHVKKSKEDIPE